MPAVRHCSRTDTFELKLQMERSLGVQKSEKYFNLLTRYLSLKLGKSEFDKQCIRLIGRENIRLQNELIKAILKNAAVSTTPPPKQVKRDNPLTFFKYLNGGFQSPRERKFKDRRIPITAPFGVNIHSNKAQKTSHNDYTQTCHYSGQLLSINTLENRLRHKLKTEGLDISMDCVSLLNNGLDSYLRRVIKPSLELASSRFINEPRKRFTASLLDFKMATMTNPEMLGEDWSIQLEKICLSGFDQ